MGITKTSVKNIIMSTADSTTQVRIQLSTRHSDISLPENPGPILVNTSNVILKPFDSVPPDDRARSSAIRSLHACEYFITV